VILFSLTGSSGNLQFVRRLTAVGFQRKRKKENFREINNNSLRDKSFQDLFVDILSCTFFSEKEPSLVQD